MLAVNRSMPAAAVIPELGYPDVRDAASWLVRAFGFEERLRIAGHRVQLTFGQGAVVVTEAPADPAAPPHAIMVRVADADAHCRRAREAGAHVLREPTDHPYGERQYTVRDHGGHVWTFSQTIADVAPSSWGGELAAPAHTAAGSAEQVVQRQLEAYNDRHLERFIATYADDVQVFRPPAAEPAIVGKAALAAHYAGKRFNLPGLHAHIVSRLVMGNKVVDHERITGVREQPFEAMAVYEVVDGAIRTVWFFDPE
jgi:uncharacterized glyoxalase superfamily protein PhnB